MVHGLLDRLMLLLEVADADYKLLGVDGERRKEGGRERMRK